MAVLSFAHPTTKDSMSVDLYPCSPGLPDADQIDVLLPAVTDDVF